MAKEVWEKDEETDYATQDAEMNRNAELDEKLAQLKERERIVNAVIQKLHNRIQKEDNYDKAQLLYDVSTEILQEIQ